LCPTWSRGAAHSSLLLSPRSAAGDASPASSGYHTSVCDGSVAGFHCKQHPQIECEILVSFDLLDYFSDLLAMILQVR
jgi:hypothetical protein